MRDYEIMTIHRPDLAEDDIDKRITNRDMWGKRRFAYEIDHISEGYYTVLKFQSGTETIDPLDRMLSLTDEVVRHKIVRIDED